MTSKMFGCLFFQEVIDVVKLSCESKLVVLKLEILAYCNEEFCHKMWNKEKSYF